MPNHGIETKIITSIRSTPHPLDLRFRHLPHRAFADVGGHAQEVGDAVAQVRAEGVDEVADADVFELRDAQWAFRPGKAVVEFVGFVVVDRVRFRRKMESHNGLAHPGASADEVERAGPVYGGQLGQGALVLFDCHTLDFFAKIVFACMTYRNLLLADTAAKITCRCARVWHSKIFGLALMVRFFPDARAGVNSSG